MSRGHREGRKTAITIRKREKSTRIRQAKPRINEADFTARVRRLMSSANITQAEATQRVGANYEIHFA